jgi:hypothetical protein
MMEQMSPVDTPPLPTRYVVVGLYRGALFRMVKDRLYDGPDKTTAFAVFEAAKPISRYKTLNIGEGVWDSGAYRWTTLENTQPTRGRRIVRGLVNTLASLVLVALLIHMVILFDGWRSPHPASGSIYQIELSGRNGSHSFEYVTEQERDLYNASQMAQLILMVTALVVCIPGEISFRRARKRIVALGGQAPAKA